MLARGRCFAGLGVRGPWCSRTVDWLIGRLFVGCLLLFCWLFVGKHIVGCFSVGCLLAVFLLMSGYLLVVSWLVIRTNT